MDGATASPRWKTCGISYTQKVRCQQVLRQRKHASPSVSAGVAACVSMCVSVCQHVRHRGPRTRRHHRATAPFASTFPQQRLPFSPQQPHPTMIRRRSRYCARARVCVCVRAHVCVCACVRVCVRIWKRQRVCASE